MNYLHSIGIIHLDLNPSNILLTSDRHCVISDFSCSVLDPLTKRKEKQEIPFPTYRIRDPTPYFSAPEVVAKQPVSARADMWSVGMVVFDLVCPDYLPLILEEDAAPGCLSRYQMLNPTDLSLQMGRQRVPHSVSNIILSVSRFATTCVGKI